MEPDVMWFSKEGAETFRKWFADWQARQEDLLWKAREVEDNRNPKSNLILGADK